MHEEGLGVHAKPWQNEMDALCRDARALDPNSQDMDWLFCFNPRAFEIAKSLADLYKWAHKLVEAKEIKRVAHGSFKRDDRHSRNREGVHSLQGSYS
ncbi:hypothetical protein J1N35_018874 [Gossypium stocksii]|uniref:Uncharacterized protein n=1 Tax=Gossypium stocksii TaxID=47602 RepID=A0A9D3VR58_9ROSI|nr:hypothetical protein J1N35_018874 [Gossypium stocksii]